MWNCEIVKLKTSKHKINISLEPPTGVYPLLFGGDYDSDLAADLYGGPVRCAVALIASAVCRQYKDGSF
jgi:hypothetical protein